MNVSAYLKRIRYDGSLEPTAQTLRDLQMAHLTAVPFENLSIHANEPTVLTNEALFDKIVVRRQPFRPRGTKRGQTVAASISLHPARIRLPQRCRTATKQFSIVL